MSAGGPECREKLEIQTRLGLHARAAVLLVQTASKFDAEVLISKEDQTVSGRSIMGVMTLAATQGSTIEVIAKGPQAAEALQAIRALIAAKFNEPD